MKRLTTALMLCLLAGAAEAGTVVHKCVDETGKAHYLDHACNPGTTASGFNESAGNMTALVDRTSKVKRKATGAAMGGTVR